MVTDPGIQPEEPVASDAVTSQRLDLPAGPSAASTARGFLVGCLGDVAPDVIDEVLLLTSELVTNAVLHGSAPIRLQLRRRDTTLRVDVSDGGGPFALAAAPVRSRTAEGGRGLLLIDALATDWGSRDNEGTSSGKTVWFELSGTSGTASS